MNAPVRSMSNPITMREIAPQWLVSSAQGGEPAALLESLRLQFEGEGAVLFRIPVGDAAGRSAVLASCGLEDTFRDAAIERATTAVAGRVRNEILPLMVPAWRVGGAAAFIYAFPGCARAHGQLVTAILAGEQKSFEAMAATYLASRCLMEGLEEAVGGHGAMLEQPRITAREQSCLAWTAEGKTSEEIGIILDLSPHTVNHYLGSAARKLGATNRMHAVAKALRLGLIERPI